MNLVQFYLLMLLLAREDQKQVHNGDLKARDMQLPRLRQCDQALGKSGSPAPKPITGSPAAFSSLALFVTAMVADSEIEAILSDIRFFVIVFISLHSLNRI